MIVTGVITQVNIEDRKNTFIEVRLGKVVSLLFNGDNLLDEPQPYYLGTSPSCGINTTFVSYYENFYFNLFQYNIIGYIRKNDVK